VILALKLLLAPLLVVASTLAGFAVFCLLVAVLLTPLGTAPAFLLALLGALTTQLLTSRASLPSAVTLR
jgi:hypothetical protein